MKVTHGRPRRREHGLLVEELDNELVVCDTTADSVHVLGAVAGKVWRACDGQRDVEALQRACAVDKATVIAALDGLRECGLLEGPHELAAGEPGALADVKLSRRGVLTKGAAIGAGIGLAAPVIRSIALPSSAAAASATGPGSTPAPTTTRFPGTTVAPVPG